MHIFKNGGTTIDSVLEREFYDLFATLHGPAPESVLTGRNVLGLLEEHPAIEVVSSHHLRYPKPKADGYAFFDICMLRHPLARLHSMSLYFRSAHSSAYGLKGTDSLWTRLILDVNRATLFTALNDLRRSREG